MKTNKCTCTSSWIKIPVPYMYTCTYMYYTQRYKTLFPIEAILQSCRQCNKPDTVHLVPIEVWYKTWHINHEISSTCTHNKSSTRDYGQIGSTRQAATPCRSAGDLYQALAGSNEQALTGHRAACSQSLIFTACKEYRPPGVSLNFSM